MDYLELKCVLDKEKGVCPRCGEQGVDLGPTVVNVGRTRGIKVTVFECTKCRLVFFERLFDK